MEDGVIVSVPPPAGCTLARKMCRIMAAIENIPKNGHNTFSNYFYATDQDILMAVRKPMAANGVMAYTTLVSRADSQLDSSGGKKLHWVSVKLSTTFVDCDSGETYCVEMDGDGSDTGDKAFAKAVTSAVKYTMLKTFLLPTGDDPEVDSAEVSGERKVAAKSALKPRTLAAAMEARKEQAPAAATTRALGPVRLTGSRKAATSSDPKKPWVRYELDVETGEGHGEVYSTFDRDVAVTALQAVRAGALVMLTLQTNAAGKVAVTAIAAVDEGEADSAEPPAEVGAP